MTIKEIAELTGCSNETVRSKAKELFPLNFEKGKTTRFSQLAAYDIVSALRKKGFIQPTENQEVPTKNQDVDLKSAFIMMAKSFERLTGIMENQETRIKDIETMINNRKVLLPAPGMEPSQHINKLVREYAEKNNLEFRDTWHKLYTEFGYRMHSNPVICAKNRGMSIIDYIKTEGMIDILESIAIELFKE